MRQFLSILRFVVLNPLVAYGALRDFIFVVGKIRDLFKK